MTRDAEHTPSPQSVVVPVERVQRYLDRLAKSRQHDQERIHAFDLGEPSEAELFVSDLRALVSAAAPAPPPQSVVVPVELAETPAIRNALGLYRSAILCGERWSDTCRDAYLAALKELDQLAMLAAAPAPPAMTGGEVLDRFERAAFAKVQNLPRGAAARAEEIARRDAEYDAARNAILAALSPEAPAREGVERALHLKLLDTLKPFAEVAEKLKHCHVVEICEPTPDNPSRNIIPMPREWFERAADDLEAIAIQLHSDGVLSEGQAAKLTGLDRVEVRKQVDALTPRHEAPASEGEAS